MTTLIGKAVLRELDARNITQVQLAARAGIHHTVITKLIAGRRPSPETLRAICNSWEDAELELGLLCEHLRDEIDRAGKLQDEIDVQPSGVVHKNPDDLDKDLDIIRQEAMEHHDVYDLLHDLAGMIRRNREGTGPALKVAEPSAEYKVKRARKKKPTTDDGKSPDR